MERLRNFQQKRLEIIMDPIPFRIQISDRLVKSLTIAPILNSVEMPFYIEGNLIYLPEYYVSFERLKDISKDSIKKIPENFGKENLLKISLLKNGLCPNGEKYFLTLAYILYIGKKYYFDFNEKGDVFVMKKEIKRSNISLAKSRIPLFYNKRINSRVSTI